MGILNRATPSRAKRSCILLGTALLALVASVQTVHLACDYEPPPQDAPAAHDMVLHHGSAPCLLCLRAHFGAQITARASTVPAVFGAPASAFSEHRPGSRLAIFSLYIRPPPAL